MAGYVGPTLRVGDIVSGPRHSLLLQSYKPQEMVGGTVNADGYGAALWLDDGRPDPALYKTAVPIWADLNLGWMNERLAVRSLIAAVRSATPGIGFELANVQPFARGNLAFAHNGFIAKFRAGVQRQLREGLGQQAYEAIEGSSDSEHIFALILDSPCESLDGKVRNALQRLEAICSELHRPSVATVLLGDGDQLVAARWAHGCRPATLYWSPFGAGGVCFASEPLDGTKWREIPCDHVALSRPGEDLRLERLR